MATSFPFNPSSTIDAEIEPEENEEFIQVLLLIPFCLLIGNIVRHFAIEFKVLLPYTAILLLIGMLMGYLESIDPTPSVLGEAIDAVKHMSPHLLLGAFIPPLVFESAFGTEWHVIRREFGQSILLAFPGVIINTLLVAIFCVYGFPYNWTWSEAITFGSIVSATDPVAVVALLRDLGASKRLATLIEGESLLNDGSAFVVFTIALEFVKGNNLSAGEVVAEFCLLTFGGILMGLAFGMLAVIWLRLVFNDERIEIMITFIACYLVFWLCENEIHASGTLGAVFCGLYLSKYKSAISPGVEESLHHFWEVFSYIMNTLVFIFAGILVVVGVLEDSFNTINFGIDFLWNILLYFILHIARAITILLLYWFLRRMGYGIDWKECVVLILAGLRGAIALALALMTKLERFPNPSFKDLVMFHVSFIVFWTLVLNGTFMKYIVRGLGLTKTSVPAQIVLKDAMKHLRKETKKKMLGMKGDPNYSGANWEVVVRKLPSYAYMLGYKEKDIKYDDDNDDKQTICQTICCCCKKTTKEAKYQKVEILKKQSNSLAVKGRNNESKVHLKRFGVDIDNDNDNKSDIDGVDDDNSTNIEMVQDPKDDDDDKENDDETKEEQKTTDINNKDDGFVYTDYAGVTNTKTKTSAFTSTSISADDDIIKTHVESQIDSFAMKMNISRKISAPLSEAHITNTFGLIVKPGQVTGTHVNPRKLITTQSQRDTMEEKVDSSIIRSQIIHRVLLVLQRTYAMSYEEGIISLDSYMILEKAVSYALDDDNLEILNKMIINTFKLNKFSKWFYSTCKASLSQYLLLNELTKAIEVGLVFIASFELLKSKLSFVPIIASSPLLIDIISLLNKQSNSIREEWINLHEAYPDVYNTIQTRHAIQTVIHYEAKDIQELFERGLLEEMEYIRMTKALLKTQHKLYYSSFYYITDIHQTEKDKKRTLLSIIFMTKLKNINTSSYNNKINELMKHLDERLFNKNDIIIKKGKTPTKTDFNGLFVLISGTASLIMNTNAKIYNNDNINNKDNDDKEEIAILKDNENSLSPTKHSSEFYITRGSIIGGLAYLTQTAYLNTIIAKTSCEFFFISDKSLQILFQNEKESFEFLWRQVAANVIFALYHKNNHSFFAFYTKTDINIMCQQSTFREFNNSDQNQRILTLHSHIILLLDGNAYIGNIVDNNNNNSVKTLKSPSILLPFCNNYYKFSYGAKILILDHDPKQYTKSRLFKKRKQITPYRRQ